MQWGGPHYFFCLPNSLIKCEAYMVVVVFVVFVVVFEVLVVVFVVVSICADGGIK